MVFSVGQHMQQNLAVIGQWLFPCGSARPFPLSHLFRQNFKQQGLLPLSLYTSEG